MPGFRNYIEAADRLADRRQRQAGAVDGHAGAGPQFGEQPAAVNLKPLGRRVGRAIARRVRQMYDGAQAFDDPGKQA